MFQHTLSTNHWYLLV